MNHIKGKKVSKKNIKRKKRGHSDLNQGPIDLQSIALPLSYTPFHENAADKHTQ